MNIFKIKEKKFYNLDGSTELSDKVLIKPLDYPIFSPVVVCYYEVYNQKGGLINSPGNITMDTPEEWGNDDVVLLNKFAEKLGVEIIEEYNKENDSNT